MKNYVCTPLKSQPGIQRDGTPYDGPNFIDGQWVRFYRQKPRKIGGVNAVDYGNTSIVRDMYSLPNGSNVDVYLGRADSLNYISLPVNDQVDINSVAEIERTPTTLVTNANNSWSFDTYTSYFDLYESPQIIGQVSPNANDINNSENGYVYYGAINNNNPLTPIFTVPEKTPGTELMCSGGVVFISPLLVALGNNGQLLWNNPSDTTDPLNSWMANETLLNTNVIANTKLIKGFNVVGANAPTGLIWSLNSLSRITYIPTSTNDLITYALASTPIDNTITVLAANSIVNYKQTYFWIGTDQFYIYDGVLRPIPNTLNKDWFFNNVNMAHANKIFGVVIPRYDEIWWYFPFGESTENNAVLIYNYAENFWFDTRSSRSAGISANLFPKPLMADNQSITIQTRQGPRTSYPIWEHETGVNRVIGNESYPINSYYSHHLIDICSQEGAQNRQLRNRRIETDFAAIGNMEMSITNLNYASDIRNGKAIIDGPYTFDTNTQYIDVASQGRLTSIKFSSNELDGYYQAGKTLYDWEIGDINT
jgi:hypothetical protein